MNNKLNKKKYPYDHPISCSAASHLKIYLMFPDSACYTILEFSKNFINIYTVINVLVKIANFSFNRKGFYPNSMRLSENVTKFIEIVLLKFEASIINRERDKKLFTIKC